MPRAAVDKAVKTFLNGFITEATGLTFPEDSVRDIDNCDIELKGILRRRLGLNEELDGFTVGSGLYNDTNFSGLGGTESLLMPGPVTVPKRELAISYHIWRTPGGVSAYTFIVFQIGNNLIVRNLESQPVSSPIAITSIVSGPTQFVIDDASTGFIYNAFKSDAAKIQLQSASGFGRLWFTSSHTVPFYMEFDPDATTITLRRSETTLWAQGLAGTFVPRRAIRDFNGADDGLNLDNEPTTLSTAHKYNLINQGWGNDEWDEYFADVSRYPSNAQQWFFGKNATGDFNGFDLARQMFGNSQAPRGHVVYDALWGRKVAIDPDNTADQVNLTAEDEKAQRGWRSVTFFAGRVWYAGDENFQRPNGVYFSKILQQPSDAAVFCQVQDPTNEHFPDLLATDGGVIYIPEADHIYRLEPFSAGVLVFAGNGVWFIYGGEVGFSATQISLDKVSATGIISPTSVVRTDQLVAFWADNGIHVLALPQQGVVPVVNDITRDKIYSYYTLIPREAREKAHGAFDPISKKIFWSWLSQATYSYPVNQQLFNQMLILDTRTGAFSKYSFTVDTTIPFGPSVVFPKHTVTSPAEFNNLVLVGSDVVQVGLDDVVVGTAFVTTDEFLNSVKVVCVDGSLQALRIMEFYDVNFRDYATMVTVVASNYTSYVVTRDEVVDDLQRYKQATYLHSFFKRTETGFELDSTGLNLIPKRPSGCTVIGRWDWHDTITGGRWTNSQSAYRYRRPYTPVDINDTYDTGEDIVYTKLKIRGKGRALTLRYDSVANKDFQLLGYSIALTVNAV